MKLWPLFLLTVVCVGSGCSAAGVPYTSDPYEKLQIADKLIDYGRAIPAEKLTKQALEIFKKNGDKLGEAEAYFLLGCFYKSQAYRDYEEFYKKTHLEYYPCCEKTIESCRSAVQLYLDVGDYMGAAKSYFAMGNAFGLEKNIPEQCQMFENSIAAYRKGKALKEGQQEFPILNPHFDNFEDMVTAFMHNFGCNLEN